MGACFTQKILRRRSKTVSFLIFLIIIWSYWFTSRNEIGLSPSLLLELSNVNKLFADVSLRWGILDNSPLEQGLCLPSHPQHWSLTADIYFKLCSFPVNCWPDSMSLIVFWERWRTLTIAWASPLSASSKKFWQGLLWELLLCSPLPLSMCICITNNLALRTYGWYIEEMSEISTRPEVKV